MGAFDEVETINLVQRQLAVVVGWVAEILPARNHLGDYVLLKGGFAGIGCHAASASVSVVGAGEALVVLFIIFRLPFDRQPELTRPVALPGM